MSPPEAKLYDFKREDEQDNKIKEITVLLNELIMDLGKLNNKVGHVAFVVDNIEIEQKAQKKDLEQIKEMIIALSSKVATK